MQILDSADVVLCKAHELAVVSVAAQITTT
jgi:hypothetical protein